MALSNTRKFQINQTFQRAVGSGFFDIASVIDQAIQDAITDNVIATDSEVQDAIPSAEKGAINGVATLDGSGKIPSNQLTLDAVQYKGAWNATTNSPVLADGTGTIGDFYRVSVAGTRNLGSGSLEYRAGDTLIHNGTLWERIPSADLLPVAQYRYVRSYGNDTTGDGSLERPWATLSFAESQITDNSSANPYTIDIGRGTYALTAGYAKKPNIHWSGAGRFGDYGTNITLGGGAGGMTITPTTTSDIVTFNNLGMTTSTGGVIVNQTGYKTTTTQATTALTLRFLFCSMVIGGNFVTFNGTDQNVNQVFLFGCQMSNSAVIRSASFVAYFSYISALTSITENASQPDTAITVSCNTVVGSTTVTLVGGNTSGLIGGLNIEGTGILPGAITALAPPGATVTMDKPATLTQTGVMLTFKAQKQSSCQMFMTRYSGLTVDKRSAASVLDGSYNAGAFTLNDAGSTALVTPETVRGVVTQGANTYIGYIGTTPRGIRYIPTVSQNWDRQSITSISIAAPGLFTKVAHGLVFGDAIMLSTTGALPTGLNATTVYFVYPVDADTFYVSAAVTFPGFVTTSGSQSGSHFYAKIPVNLIQALDQLAANKQNAAGLLALDSSASVGGATSEALTVTGLLSTDTILSVSQKTPGTAPVPMVGWSGQVNNALTVQWTADTLGGAVVRVAVKR